jgi:transcriptional regulator with XRE-family HTH domain
MTFIERIKQLRENSQLPQRKLAEALDIDSATYCKIEKGERKAKREQVIIIAEILQANQGELLSLWLADQLTAVVADEKELATQAFKVAQKRITK